MDYSAWQFWMDQLHWILGIAVLVYGWLVARMQKLSARIRALEEATDKRLDDHGERLARNEAALTHAPTREDLGRIHKRIDEVGASVARIEGAETAARAQLDLIHQHLLERHG